MHGRGTRTFKHIVAGSLQASTAGEAVQSLKQLWQLQGPAAVAAWAVLCSQHQLPL